MKTILFAIILIYMSAQSVYSQREYNINIDKTSKKLALYTKSAAKDTPVPNKGVIDLEEGDEIKLSGDLTNDTDFPVPNLAVQLSIDDQLLNAFFNKGKPYDIIYKEGKIHFKTESGIVSEKLKESVVVTLTDEKRKQVFDKIEFKISVAVDKPADSIFIIDLDNLKSCHNTYLESLASTEANANLIVFTANAVPKEIGKIEIFRNYKMMNDEKLEEHKKIYKGAGSLKLRKGTQLGVLTKNYNFLLYKVDVASQGSNYVFEDTNLLNTLQTKLPTPTSVDKSPKAQATEEEKKKNAKIELLLHLYRTISHDLVELQTNQVLDHCMMNDYFSQLRGKMATAGIPTSLSQFSNHVSQLAENQSSGIKTNLESLVDLYKNLFVFASPPAPVFPTIVSSKDYQQFDVEIKSLRDNKVSTNTEPITADIVGGWRTSFSGSFLQHWLTDERYFLTDGENQQREDGTSVTLKRINRAEDDEGAVFAAGAQFNLYNQLARVIGFGPSIGLASDIFSGNADRLRITLGGNILITTSVGRFGLTGGYIWGNVNKLQYGYKVATDANDGHNAGFDLPANDPPLRSDWENSKFIGITYSLPSKSNTSNK